ncbi:SO_0444 family Cu/Zn efflux transporter [bacterium]|nr:SO_0444 family Cu/Zn efflux transporter [bacterium]
MSSMSEIVLSIFHTLVDASLYLLVGFLSAGFIKAFVRTETIVRYMGQSNMSSVLRASLIGTPLPLCSCSVIPMGVSLHKTGASKGATVSFLISAPETGIDSVAISYAMLDPLMTVFRPVAAFVTAFIAGIAENIQSRKDDTKPQGNTSKIASSAAGCDDDHCRVHAPHLGPESTVSVYARLKSGIHYAFTDLLGDIAYYLLIGMVISAIISVAIPEDFFSTYFHNETITMFVMLAIGIPLYVCASASTPIAAALIMKGISPGAALVFLLAGPATNISTMSVVKSTLGTRSIISYILSIAIAALLLGFLLNTIYTFFGIEIVVNMGNASEIVPDTVKYGSAIIFLPLLFWSLGKEIKMRLSKKIIPG